MDGDAPLLQIGRLSGHSKAGELGVPRAKWSHLRPSNALVYVENRCHLRCEHCYESAESHPHHHRLDVKAYERVFNQLAELGVLFVTVTGGEIFLRPDLLDIVAAARARRFAITLYTSGTLIDAASADALARLQVNSVHVSVYSHDPAVHDAFTRSPRSHEKSVRALRLLHERGVPTVLKANIMRCNIDHLDELIALARSVGAEHTFDPTVKPRMNGDAAPLELAVPPDEIRRLVLSRPDLTPAFRRLTPEALCTGERGVLDDDDVMCGAARSTVAVAADGAVSACGFFPIAAGTISDDVSIADIWFGSAQLDEVRETTLAKMNECGGCEVRSTCAPCMAYALVEHGDQRACNSSSRQAATALHLLARNRARANARMSTGRQLPIVGERTLPVVTSAALSSEP